MDKTPRTDALKIPSEALLLLGNKGVPERIAKAILMLGDHARQLETELSAANAQLAEYKRDAERYRWLRDQYTVPYGLDWQGHIQNIIVFWDDGTGLDAAIDAAMDQTDQTEQKR